MQCCTELVPPTGITHSLHASFTSLDANNLIIARTSLLQVFKVTPYNDGPDFRLVYVAQFPLSGTVTGFGKVKLLQSKSGGDALLVSFKDAKLSLIEWDPINHNISTISIHYYENHDLLLCPWTPDLDKCPSHLTVDPSSRCAAYHFGINNLAVIPFHQINDDLAMDDFDDVDGDDDVDKQNGTKTPNGETDHKTPYSASFVLPLTVLDPNLLHPVDMAFLHEFREPTIGILYSTRAPSVNMAAEHKDVMIYAVYTLDIEQRASTTLLSISKLPNDVRHIIPLPLPVGGSLLVGGNQIIHIDQGGKINAIGVNEFAKQCTSLPMTDHSHLRMRLEGSQIENVGTATGEMLISLSTGELATLNFHLDGRSVAGLAIQLVASDEVAHWNMAQASSMTNVDTGCIFIGSEESDSLLIGTSSRLSLKRVNSRIQQNGADQFEDNDAYEDEDDDLYAPAGGLNGHMDGIAGNKVSIMDRLVSLGPVNDISFGKPSSRIQDTAIDETPYNRQESPSLELAMACCRGKAGALALLQQKTSPVVTSQFDFDNLLGVWSIKTQNTHSGAEHEAFDDTVIFSTIAEDGPARSSLMSLNQGQLEPREGTEFDGNTSTVAVGRFATTNHTVQVSANDIRVYDAVDEDSGEIAQVSFAIILEPYVVFLKDDDTLCVLKADKNGELDEIEIPENVPTKDVSATGLYHDVQDFFQTSKYEASSNTLPRVILSVLTKDGALGLYPLSDLKVEIFQFIGLQFLPLWLSSEMPIPKHWKYDDKVAEILLADLGDDVHQNPHLIIRNTTGDIIVYEAYSIPRVEGAYRFIKVVMQNADATDMDNETDEFEVGQSNQRLQPIHNINGFHTVFVTGRSASVILKAASSSTKIHRLRELAIKHVSAIHDGSNQNGFVYIDSDSSLKIGQLPSNVLFDLCDYPVRKLSLGEEPTKIAYHSPSGTYLLSTITPTVFQLPQDDEWHPEWTEESTNFLPSDTFCALKLISSTTYSTISTYQFEPNEHILTLKCLPLSVSEETHETQQLVAVGTAVTKGENAVTRGNIYVFSVAEVNPDPDIPESGLKLKLITKEDVRGSVSAITSIGSQGFLLASQGQRAMVRGLKEDKTLLPVAFVDIRFHLSVARELAGTGLTIMGDAVSGLWLMGYSEEPYKLQIIARDLENPHVISADFLPDDRSLYIFSSDAEGVIRVLEYDPENPKTERGTKLLLRSTFNTGSYQTTMTLIPRTPTSSEALTLPKPKSKPTGKKSSTNNNGKKQRSSSHQEPNSNSDSDSEFEPEEARQQSPTSKSSSSSSSSSSSIIQQQDQIYKKSQLILTSTTGGITLITPLSESTYRRLSTLQNILTTQLDQPCSLNPRAYRAVETDGVGGRGMIDGNVVSRWLALSSWHKGVAVGKVGGSVWDLRGDMEGICGGGIGFL